MVTRPSLRNGRQAVRFLAGQPFVLARELLSIASPSLASANVRSARVHVQNAGWQPSRSTSGGIFPPPAFWQRPSARKSPAPQRPQCSCRHQRYGHVGQGDDPHQLAIASYHWQPAYPGAGHKRGSFADGCAFVTKHKMPHHRLRFQRRLRDRYVVLLRAQAARLRSGHDGIFADRGGSFFRRAERQSSQLLSRILRRLRRRRDRGRRRVGGKRLFAQRIVTGATEQPRRHSQALREKRDICRLRAEELDAS
jgi:hypothetical protein